MLIRKHSVWQKKFTRKLEVAFLFARTLASAWLLETINRKFAQMNDADPSTSALGGDR
jgi:hypothetical protein